MKKILKNLRNRPEEERTHILHISTAVIAVIIVAFWAFSLKHSTFNAETKANIQRDLEPFKSLKADITESYHSISNISNSEE